MSKQENSFFKSNPKVIITFAALVLAAAVIYYFNIPVPFIYHPFVPNDSGDVSVQFIDVGQGDSIFIHDHDTNVLIDAGENDKGAVVVEYLRDQGINDIDIAIGTHPHSDHIGGLDTVMENIPVTTLLLPVIPDSMIPTTKTYQDVLTTAQAQNVNVVFAQPGTSYPLSSGTLDILGPIGTYDDLNSYSIVSRFSYGNTSFLFTGDMEKDAETDLIEAGVDLHATVLKLGHHGSNTSSSAAFLKAVGAEYYAVCVGEDNSYGHPSQEVLNRLDDAPVYRTDADGSIIFSTDGNTIEVQTEH